jgi:hypothetical protein
VRIDVEVLGRDDRTDARQGTVVNEDGTFQRLLRVLRVRRDAAQRLSRTLQLSTFGLDTS